MARKVKIVATTLAADSAGNVVDALPVREEIGPTLNEVGQYVDPIEVEIDDLAGSPVRYVAGLVTTDSAGRIVPVTPIKGGSNPITILGSSLLGWWTADRPDLMTLAGSLVASWRDVVGGYEVSQAVGGSRPVYSPSSFGGAPGVFFDGIDDVLALASVPAAFPVGATPGETHVVFQDDAPVSDSVTRRMFDYGGATNNDVVSFRTIGNGTAKAATWNVGTGASFMGASPGVLYQPGTRHSFNMRWSATGGQGWLDGVATGVIAGVPAIGSTITLLGRGSNGAGFMWGQLRDAIVTAPLTAEQTTAFNAWKAMRRMV